MHNLNADLSSSTHRERKELYAKSLEIQNLQLKEQLSNMVKQRDAYANENRILRDLLRVNGIAYHASPFAVDTLARDKTYDQRSVYTDSKTNFATAPQTNGGAAHQTNGYPEPPCNYESSSATASPNDELPEMITPETASMSLTTVPTTQTKSSMSESQNSQLTQQTDYSNSTFVTAPGNDDVYTNGYYRGTDNYPTTSADVGYGQTIPPVDPNLMVADGAGYDLGRHIGQLELQVGNGRQEMYNGQTNGNISYQNTTGVYGPPAFDLYEWMRTFVFA